MVLARALAALLLAATAGCRAPAPPERPSFVIVTLDAFRADRLEVYGGPPHLTPFLNGLAARSTVFEHATTPIGATHPAHASLFTGLYPGIHRVQRNGHHLDPRFTTLAERLTREGYETAAFVQAGALLGGAGLARGFAVHNDAASFHGSAEVTRSAEEWLARRDPARPFLLWVHYFEAHLPFRLTSYSEPVMSARGGPLACGALTGQVRAYGSDELPPGDSTRSDLAVLYDGAAREDDRCVMELLSAIASRGLWERTVTIVTADHGQLLGEHGRTGYGDVVWEDALHVPLIVHAPKQAEQRLVEARVSLIDVYPTILEWLDLRRSSVLAGRSLLGAIRGEALDDVVVLASTPAPPDGDTTPDPNLVAAYLGSTKAIAGNGTLDVYDLASDPRELSPLPSSAQSSNLSLVEEARAHRRREREKSPAP